MPNELDEKLAKWAGFVYDPPNEKARGYGLKPCGMWIAPDGNFDSELPDFVNSLDDCFEWLVPKLWAIQLSVINTMGDRASMAMVDLDGDLFASDFAKTPALALCKAIEKVIDA